MKHLIGITTKILHLSSRVTLAYRGQLKKIHLNLNPGIILVIVVVSICLLSPAQARAISISPPIAELVVDPGSTVRGQLRLIGTQDQGENVSVKIEEFRKVGLGNMRVFFKPEVNSNSVGHWIRFTDPYEALMVKKGQVLILNYTLQVPVGAKPGGHYAAFMISAAGAGESIATVGVSSRVAAQLLLTVTGQEKVELSLESLQTARGNKTFAHLPIDFKSTVKNTGNTHVSPVGFLEPLEGETRVVSIPFNPDNQVVFPGTTKLFTQKWQEAEPIVLKPARNPVMMLRNFLDEAVYELKHFRLGSYEVRLGMVYGEKMNLVEEKSIKVYLVPYHLFILMVILTAVVRLGFYLKSRLSRGRRS